MAEARFGFGISINVDTKKMAQEILKAAVKQININMENEIRGLKERIGQGFVDRLKATPTYDSIVSDFGQLHDEFGIPNPQYAMNSILSKLKLCFDVVYKKARIVNNDRIEATFSVQFNKQDFTFLYNDGAFKAAFNKIFKRAPTTKFKTAKKDTITWLQWLLESGNSPVILDYHVSFDDRHSKYSRTGGYALMFHGGSWGVPPKFAGTITDNWLTRTLAEYEKDIEESLNVIIRQGLKNVSN